MRGSYQAPVRGATNYAFVATRASTFAAARLPMLTRSPDAPRRRTASDEPSRVSIVITQPGIRR